MSTATVVVVVLSLAISVTFAAIGVFVKESNITPNPRSEQLLTLAALFLIAAGVWMR